MKKIPIGQNIRSRLKASQASPIRVYKDLTVGESASTAYFFLYELLTSFLGPLPGGLGFLLRKKLYPLLLKRVGSGLIIGRNVTIRHPNNIQLGNNVTVDDNCLIDARGAGENGITFDDDVIINRNCMIQAKSGPIYVGNRTSIGSNSVIVSIAGVNFGKAVLVAGGCTVSPGSYNFHSFEEAIMDQGIFTTGPVTINAKSWIGTNVTILDGVTIGIGAIIGAGALVRQNIPDNMIAVGVPAKIIKER